MKEFKVFQAIQDEPSKNGKIALLKQHDSARLRDLLLMTYDKFRTYRIKQIDSPETYSEIQPDIFNELYQLLAILVKHETGTNSAKAMIRKLLEKCSSDGAKWVTRIIQRDLACGVDESTINKAFKDLIPTFSCQLAHPIYSERTDKNTGQKIVKNYWPTLKYPVLVEEKLDGFRVIAVCKGGKVTFYTREGHEVDDRGVFASEIFKLMPGTDFVLDGEVIAKKFNPNSKVAVKNAFDNWPFYQGKSMISKEETSKEEIKEFVGYYVWDVLAVDFFESQGTKGKKQALKERKVRLQSLFERHERNFNNLFRVDGVACFDEASVKAVFDAVRKKGGQELSAVDKKGKEVKYKSPNGEGCMVKDLDAPYEFKRSAVLLKVKSFSSMDLRIISAYEGEKDSKNEGSLGGLVLESDCGTIKTRCGGGFSDDKRMELWLRWLDGSLVGGIVEVSYMDITVDGALRHCNFVRERDDRTTTSIGG